MRRKCVCSGEDALYTAQKAERDRNAAAVRVRARRRIRRALGDIQIPGDLAPVLRLVVELEKRDRQLVAELSAVINSFRGENI